MKIIKLRRITADAFHNAFVGCQWFRDALYVAYRQGDHHAGDDNQGRIVVMRCRDGGDAFDTVAVVRAGNGDMRDAHLYTDGRRLYLTSWEASAARGRYRSGCARSDDGLTWIPWTYYDGTQGDGAAPDWILWRPEFFGGRHYGIGYATVWGAGLYEHDSFVAWFESDDGVRWRKARDLCRGVEKPNEASMDFQPDGRVAALVRRETPDKHPILLRSRPPYEEWASLELDVPLAGPALWLVDDQVWFSGRWFLSAGVTHVGVFRLENEKPVLKMVLPSGPQFDCSYMGVSRRADNRRRMSLAYYSNHEAPPDARADQWGKTDIYLVDAFFGGSFMSEWDISDVTAAPRGLRDARSVEPGVPGLTWRKIACLAEDKMGEEEGFVDASKVIAGRSGVVYFHKAVDVGPCERARLFLGYDGPVRVWINDAQVFEGVGKNPAIVDQSSVAISLKHGVNKFVIALDTNNGRACGIFARYEPEG
mgnify:CR=1 FL=1